MAAIIVTIVVIVVAAITQQWWLTEMCAPVSGTVAAGTAVYSATAYVGAAMIGAAVGNIAGQLVGMGLGIQDKFSWGAVASAGLAGGLTAGIGNGLPKNAGTLDTILAGASKSLVSQGVNILTGQQEDFNWTGLATAAVMAPLQKSLSTQGDGKTAITFGEVANRVGKEMLKSALTQAVTIAINGEGKLDWARVASDGFGNGIGNSIVDQMKYSAEQKKKAADTTAPQAGNGGAGSSSPARAAPRTVTVEAGQTLSGLAGGYDEDYLNKLAYANGLPSPHDLKTGQKITMFSPEELAGKEVPAEYAEQTAAKRDQLNAAAEAKRVEAQRMAEAAANTGEKQSVSQLEAAATAAVNILAKTYRFGAALVDDGLQLLENGAAAVLLPRQRDGSAAPVPNPDAGSVLRSAFLGAAQGVDNAFTNDFGASMNLFAKYFLPTPRGGGEVPVPYAGASYMDGFVGGTFVKPFSESYDAFQGGNSVEGYEKFFNGLMNLGGAYGMVRKVGLGEGVAERANLSLRLGQDAAGNKAWISPEGLVYSSLDSIHGTRVMHVTKFHGVDQPTRTVTHGVFDTGQSNGTLQLVDEAWAVVKSGDASRVQTIKNGYIVDMQRRVGYEGGTPGAQAGNPAVNRIRLLLRNGNELITAHPYK